jgi:hypothetical protein
MDPASPQMGMSTANARIGAGFQSRAVARFVSRLKGRFEETGAGFWESVQIAVRQGPKRESYDEALRAWNGRVK